MDTDELKKILKGSTAVLMLDNGEPSFVILGYDSYKKLVSEQEKEVKINHLSSRVDKRVELPGQVSNGMDLIKGDVNVGAFQNRISDKEAEILEKINKEILSLKNEIEKEEKGAGVVPVD